LLTILAQQELAAIGQVEDRPPSTVDTADASKSAGWLVHGSDSLQARMCSVAVRGSSKPSKGKSGYDYLIQLLKPIPEEVPMKPHYRRYSIVVFVGSCMAILSSREGQAEEPKEAITHSFLATGNETYILDGSRKVIWRYGHSSRDGWVLPNGNVLLALSTSKTYPGGGIVEVTREGKEIFSYKGTQSEVNTVQAIDKDTFLLTEAGAKPRLLEVNREGKILIEVALDAQTKDHHLQTRMARKLANGNYLVPHLLDRVVREYSPAGKAVWEVKTPHMPFTAIRLDNGNTLIGCTLGNLVIEVDDKGKTVWQVNNDDLPNKPINDACGVQRLPNGNTVVTSHHATANQVKLLEVTRDKRIVWSHTDDKKFGIHHFQILDTDGKAVEGKPLR